MNLKNGKSIGDSPIFATLEMKQSFLQKQLELYRKIKDGNNTWNDMNIFRMKYGYPDTNIDSLRRGFRELGNYDENGWIQPTAEGALSATDDKMTVSCNYEKDTFTSTKEICLSEEDIKDPEKLLKAHGFDPNSFKCASATNSKTNRLTPKGETIAYYSRITVKPIDTKIKDISEVLKLFENYSPKKSDIKFSKKKSNEYLVLPLYDMHWGRMPDKEDFEGFDVYKEKQKILDHVKKYIDKFNGRTFKRIYLVVGQDYLNSSFTGYTSSQSHLQDNALDFRTMFKTGAELLIDIIDMFANTSNEIEVIGSLGNHDTAEEVALFALLSAYYRNVKKITIDDGTSPRKYIKLGASCIGFGHLDKEGDRIFGLMQIEAKEYWASTKNHIFIAGHLHHFRVDNKHGVELYRVPSICYRDRWTVENGYVTNEQKTMCFIFDEENGLIENHFMYL